MIRSPAETAQPSSAADAGHLWSHPTNSELDNGTRPRLSRGTPCELGI